MLVLKKISGAKKAVLIAVLAVIFSVIGYLLYGSFLAGKLAVGPGNLPVDVLTATAVNSEFNFDFLNKFPYNKLRRPANLPVSSGKLGRSNPFLPISFFPSLPQ